jgi:hypothetical protein
MDIKHIRDHKALTKEQIIHLDRYQIPNYQWGALDVNTRFKIISYSRDKSWTNGLCWYLWVISWLRSHGVKSWIVFTVDNGEEFGGKSWMKVRDLWKLIGGFSCRLIKNHKAQPKRMLIWKEAILLMMKSFISPVYYTLKVRQICSKKVWVISITTITSEDIPLITTKFRLLVLKINCRKLMIQ